MWGRVVGWSSSGAPIYYAEEGSRAVLCQLHGKINSYVYVNTHTHTRARAHKSLLY